MHGGQSPTRHCGFHQATRRSINMNRAAGRTRNVATGAGRVFNLPELGLRHGLCMRCSRRLFQEEQRSCWRSLDRGGGASVQWGGQPFFWERVPQQAGSQLPPSRLVCLKPKREAEWSSGRCSCRPEQTLTLSLAWMVCGNVVAQGPEFQAAPSSSTQHACLSIEMFHSPTTCNRRRRIASSPKSLDRCCYGDEYACVPSCP